MQNKRKKKIVKGGRYKIGVVKACFNDDITDGLLAGCMRALRECGVKEKNIGMLEVPGSFELPFGAQWLLEQKRYDAIVCLGAIIKGETKHHKYIAMACSKGIMDVTLKYNTPVLFGVLTTSDIEQARARSGNSDNNKGYEAAMAGVELLNNLSAIPVKTGIQSR